MTTSKDSNSSAEPEVVEPSGSNRPAPTAAERDFILTRRDAAAGGPADASVTGEEDPGAGLEFLVHK